MTNLMSWVRTMEVRGGTSVIAGAALVASLAGCNDRGSNVDAKKPIATTESGVEILEVVKDENARTVEAVIVARGEERRVTMEPLLDGPLPSGFSASLTSSVRDAPTSVAYGWDDASGATWFQQSSGSDTFAMTRIVANGRVSEEYVFNERSLRLEYADLGPTITDKAVNKYIGGESLAGATPDVIELAEAMLQFETFAADLPPTVTTETADGQLLTSLLGDPVFATMVVGDDVTPNRPDGLCRTFNLCAAVSCRVTPLGWICGVCLAGSLACLFMDWFCYMWCGG